jgi:hypothetical protein
MNEQRTDSGALVSGAARWCSRAGSEGLLMVHKESAPDAEFQAFAAALDSVVLPHADLAPGVGEPGYPQDCLGTSLPLPVFDKVLVGQLERRDYARYSVLFDLNERLCRMSAAGIPAKGDPEATVWLTRDGHAKALVAFLAPRHSGPFKDDAGMPPAEQVGWPRYDAIRGIAGPARAFDKGHMMDRLHLSFGPTTADARLSMAQSYFFTNVVPQTPPFNENDAKTGWPHVEGYVMALSKLGARVVHWTGPIFDDANDPVVTATGLSPDGIRVPCRFWKIVAAQRRDKPASNIACGFVLDDTARVQKTVAGINARSSPPAIAAAGPDAPALPDPAIDARAPTVYWKTLDEVAELAGFDVAAFSEFTRPVSATGKVKSKRALLGATQHAIDA